MNCTLKQQFPSPAANSLYEPYQPAACGPHVVRGGISNEQTSFNALLGKAKIDRRSNFGGILRRLLTEIKGAVISHSVEMFRNTLTA